MSVDFIFILILAAATIVLVPTLVVSIVLLYKKFKHSEVGQRNQ
jgi:hypothetical protein